MWRGDINSHKELWDPHVELDRRGEDLEDMLMERGLITLNDGSAKRYDRRDAGAAASISAHDVTVARMEQGERFSWRVLQDLSSDHLPVLVELITEIRVNRKVKRVELNIKNGDWKKHRDIMNEKIDVVREERI